MKYDYVRCEDPVRVGKDVLVNWNELSLCVWGGIDKRVVEFGGSVRGENAGIAGL